VGDREQEEEEEQEEGTRSRRKRSRGKRSRRRRKKRRRKKRRKRRTKERKRRVMSVVRCLLISLGVIRRSRISSLRELFSLPMVYSSLSSFV